MQNVPPAFPSQTIPQEKKAPTLIKKVLAVLGILILVIAFSSFSYFLGARNVDENSLKPTPTPYSTLTTPTFELPKNTPTPTTASTPTFKIPTPTTKTRIIRAISALDGFMSSNGEGSNTEEIRAGRGKNPVTRGFITFNISVFDKKTSIQKATLRLYQVKTSGSPYSVGGDLKIDHLTYGDKLDSTDYEMPALLSNITDLSTNTTVEWKEADVTEAIKDDIANVRSTSQFRIHFTDEVTGGNTTGDFAYFESADNSQETGKTPQLIIKYH
jgi:hypothetical protein